MPEKRTRRRNIWTDAIIPAITIALVVGLLGVRTFVARPFRIPSASMTPNLVPGDYILAWNVAKVGGAPDVHVGDVVVHSVAEDGRPRDFVRRVLALPGQRIAFRDGVPIVDGEIAKQAVASDVQRVDDPARLMRETLDGRTYLVEYNDERPVEELRNMREITVPEGMVFLVGDARDNANDSRHQGPFSLQSIHYKGGIVIFSGGDNRAGRPIE